MKLQQMYTREEFWLNVNKHIMSLVTFFCLKPNQDLFLTKKKFHYAVEFTMDQIRIRYFGRKQILCLQTV